MKNGSKTKNQLINELAEAHRRVAALEKSKEGHKEGSKTLQASDSLYHTFFDLAPDPMAITDFTSGRIFDFNQAFTTWSHYSPDELMGLTTTELGFWADDEDRNKVLNQLQNTGLAGDVEIQLRRKGGELRYVIFSGKIIEIGGNTWFLSHARDITERKQAEKELQESEEKYRQLVENASEAIFVAQNDKLVFVNTATANLTRYTTLELTTRPFLDFIYHEDRDMVTKRHLSRLRGEEIPHIYSFRIIRKDGQIRWGELHAILIHWEGKPATLNFLTDITERKEADAQLLSERETFFSVLHNAPYGIFVNAPNGELLLVNPEASKITGYTKDDVPTGRVLFNRMYPDRGYKKQVIRTWLEDVSTKSIDRTFRAHCKDGTVKDLEFRTFRLPDGKAVTMFVDITSRKRAEEALQESERKFRDLFEKSVVGVYLIQDDKFKYVNTKFAEISGYPIDEITDKKGPVDLVLPEDAQTVKENIQKRISGEAEFLQYEIRAITKNKEIKQLAIYGSRTIYQGRPAVIGTLIDITERKQVEQKIIESQQLLNGIFAVFPVGVVIYHSSGQCVSVNEEVARIVGGTTEQLLSQNFRRLKSWKDSGMLEAAEKTLETGQAMTLETRILTTFGKDRWFSCNLSPFHHTGELHLLLVISDITERKRIEDTLREGEERYRTAIESSNDGVAIIRGPQHLYVNRKFLEIFGYAGPEEIIGKTVTIAVHPDDAAMVADFNRRRQAGEPVPSQYEFKGIKKDGTHVYIEVSAAKTTFMGETVTLAYLRDITERKVAEEKTRQSEEKYRNIFENSIEGIFQTTPDGRFLSANPALARFYGYDSPQELMETITDITYQLFVHPEARKGYVEHLERYGFIEGFESERYKKDGTTMWTRINAWAVKGPDGKTLYYEGTSMDITSIKRSEIEREKLKEQLAHSQKMEAIGTLAGGIAHDFNNLLTALIGYGNLLQMKMDKDDPLRIYVDQILASSEKAANLTQSLLAFSRKQAVELKPQTVNAIISGIEKLLKRLLTEDIELKIMLDDKDPTVMADITKIDQVLMNLAANARDAMPSGGTLTIETHLVELNGASSTDQDDSKPGTYALISVTDTGIGMDTQTQERIFDPFFTTKEVGKGTGLGLSTVYGIIKQHRGFINVGSSPGQGSTFRIYLPVVKTQAKETEVSPLPIKRGTETILIAEDNLVVRDLTKEILTMSGYKVIEATDGDDAIQKFMEHKETIALMLVDVVMPKKNGKEVYEEIIKVMPNVKVIFMSGYTGDVVLEKGIYDDAVDFIKKPLVPDELLLKVRMVLDK